MHLVEIFLPLKRRDGSPHPSALFSTLRNELVGRFGGLTAFSRAPAEGLWEDDQGTVDRDEIVIFEVMADTIDHDWWRGFRETLERRFDQEEVLIRASEVQRI
jgi:hypothetical protein